MTDEHRPQSPNLAHRMAAAERHQLSPATTAHPAFPARAMPWQPASTRSPRTHQVPPELLR